MKGSQGMDGKDNRMNARRSLSFWRVPLSRDPSCHRKDRQHRYTEYSVQHQSSYRRFCYSWYSSTCQLSVSLSSDIVTELISVGIGLQDKELLIRSIAKSMMLFIPYATTSSSGHFSTALLISYKAPAFRVKQILI